MRPRSDGTESAATMRRCSIVLMMLSLLATGCGESGPLHAGTHAEGVDVPLSLDVAITRRPTSDYHAKHWQIHVQVVLTYRGDRQVWASNCHITGRDASGRALFGDVVGHHPLTLFTGPAGIAGRPWSFYA